MAAVAAGDEDIAQRALELIEVEYEELPAVFDAEAALQDGAPILHPDFNSYLGFPQKMDKPSNVYHKTFFEKGDLARGFAEADLIVENTYATQRVHQGYIEPQAVLVDIAEDGRVHVWVCSKVPYNTREPLATAAGIPEEQIPFHHVYIGGDFGGKGNARNTPICYYLAKATAAITLQPDGSVILGTPIFDQGTGTYTTLCQVVAEELHVPLERIQVEIWNTDAMGKRVVS